MKLTTALTRKLAEVLLSVALACSLLHAQDEVTFKAQSTLATVRFHVVQNDHYVTELKPEDVILLEDGAPRKFTVFENGLRFHLGQTGGSNSAFRYQRQCDG